MPVARCRSRRYFIGMVCPISQSPLVSLRSQANPEFALAAVSTVAYGLRSYSPDLGRWVNRDPIGEIGGNNLFGFCLNDGISLNDANGENLVIVFGCAVIATGILVAELIDLESQNAEVVQAQCWMMEEPTNLNIAKYRGELQNQLFEIREFTYEQTVDRYVGSILLDGPVGDAAAASIDAAVEGFRIFAVVKAGQKYKDVSVAVKASRGLMESLGYIWVRPNPRISMGYWRRLPGATIQSPATVNRILRETASTALDAISCAN